MARGQDALYPFLSPYRNRAPHRARHPRCAGLAKRGRMTRIGILGGSFNPAHRGHRAISLAAIAALRLDEVWWLVSPGNPLKEKSGDMAPYAARFASARAMARHAPIRASAIELKLGTRYTIDTVRALTRLYPN